MLERSCTFATAFRTATSIAGKWLMKMGPKNPCLETQLCTPQVGSYADIILVNGNPLEDLQILKEIDNAQLVIEDDRVYKHLLN